MQSLFELKSELPFDTAVWEEMRALACALLEQAPKNRYTQAIVLQTDQNNLYGAVIENALSKGLTDENALLTKLQAANDTKIAYVLCMWQDLGLDIPSMAFRKLLHDRLPQSHDCRIFVMTKNGVSVMQLSHTLK